MAYQLASRPLHQLLTVPTSLLNGLRLLVRVSDRKRIPSSHDSDSGADVNDPDVRIFNKFCHLAGKKAQVEVGFHSFDQIVAQLIPAFTDLYKVSAAYSGIR